MWWCLKFGLCYGVTDPSFILLQTIIGRENGGISFFWSWSYWSTFLLTWYAFAFYICYLSDLVKDGELCNMVSGADLYLGVCHIKLQVLGYTDSAKKFQNIR